MGEGKTGPFGAHWANGNIVVNPSVSPGTNFFVDSNSGASTNTGLTWRDPMATIDQAVNKCKASNGDIVWVHPSHAEDLAADSAIDVDLAGVAIKGIRHGRLMPTVNNTAAAGDFKLAAAGTSVENIRFTGGVDIGTGILEVSSTDCAIINCEYRDVTGQATDVIMGVDGADRLLIDGWRHFGSASAGANSAIALDGCDDVEVRNFEIYGDFAVAAIDFRTTLSARVWVHDGTIWTINAADIGVKDTVTSSTGAIGPNVNMMLLENAANITNSVTGATFHVLGVNKIANLVNEQGIQLNWTASTSGA